MRKLILLLFSFGILCSVAAQSSFSSNSLANASEEFEQTCKSYYKTKFSYNDYKSHIFNKDILIKISGNIHRGDSLHIHNIIDTLQNLIKSVKIKWVDKSANANLRVFINNNNYEGTKSSINTNSILPNLVKSLVFSFDEDLQQDQKNKVITYNLVRSITGTQRINFPKNSNMGIEKSIFSENDPLSSEFLDVDKVMVKWLYSGKPERYLRNCYSSYGGYMMIHHRSVYIGVVNAISFVVAFLFFLFLIYSEVLNLNAEKYLMFISNGSLLVLCYIVYDNVKLYLSSGFYMPDYLYIASILIAGIVLLSLVFIVEKLLFSLNQGLYFKLIVQFLSIVIIGAASASVVAITAVKAFDWYSLVSFTIFMSTVALVRVLYNYQRYKTKQLIMQKDIDLSRLSELKSKAELNALHSRINPHFLYNSLNSIATLAKIDACKTEKMALALSDFFRFAINRNNETYSAIEAEVDIVKSYLEIEKIRFGSRLDYSIEIDEAVANISIPRFIIQPLIENAIKHGVSKITNTGIVRLVISKTGENIQIKVFDNGPDFPEHLLTGHGLQSIHDKLSILYNDKAIMNWENGEHKCIYITLPITNKNYEV